MPKRKSCGAAGKNVAKHQGMDYFSSWAPVTFDWLLAEDIAVFRAVCKDWQQFAYSKIKEWLSNLMNHKHTAPRGEKPILKYRPYLYQLYDAYRFSLIDADTYVTCKDSLGFTDLFLYHGFGDSFIPVRNREGLPKRDFRGFSRAVYPVPVHGATDIQGIPRDIMGVSKDLDIVPMAKYYAYELIQSLITASSQRRKQLLLHLIAEGITISLHELLVSHAPLDLVAFLLVYHYRTAPILEPKPLNLATRDYAAFKSDYGTQLLALYNSKTKDGQIKYSSTLLDEWLLSCISWRMAKTIFPLLILLIKKKFWFLRFCENYVFGLTDKKLSDLVDAVPKDCNWLAKYVPIASDQLMQVLGQRNLLPQSYWDTWFGTKSVFARDIRVKGPTMYLLNNHILFTLFKAYLDKHPASIGAMCQDLCFLRRTHELRIPICVISCSPAMLINNLRPLLAAEILEVSAMNMLRPILGSIRYEKLIKKPVEDRVHFLAVDYGVVAE